MYLTATLTLVSWNEGKVADEVILEILRLKK